MDEEKKMLEEQETVTEEELAKEMPPFEPSPRWKRICAWIMVAIVILGVINWLVSIAYPQWPRYVMELFR